MDKYILSIDQSTQGTKALLFDLTGSLLFRSDLPHRQIVSNLGWISHDPEEIYQNVLLCVKNLLHLSQVSPEHITCVGITNQRETSVVWDRYTGKPVCHAIVWQCSRAQDICAQIGTPAVQKLVRDKTGIPLSPYFPASKFAWILNHIDGAAQKAADHRLCFGTMDTWLLYNLTGGKTYCTDATNASRTQLFDIHTLRWDKELCDAFGLCVDDLPIVLDCDSVFATTTFDGIFKKPVQICGVIGDAHAALFGQGCTKPGMAKATYGTGSSVMMNIGHSPIESSHGLITALGWKCHAGTCYAMEGNLNYTGAVVRWLQEIGLVKDPKETQTMAEKASLEDTTVLVPSFSGIGAPYWDNNAKAIIYGMTRTTGKNELVRAGIDSIAYQISDVIAAMEKDTGIQIHELAADGGATHNSYLMQCQSDLCQLKIRIPPIEELSGLGAAYMAGISSGQMNPDVLTVWQSSVFLPQISNEQRAKKMNHWHEAIQVVLKC